MKDEEIVVGFGMNIICNYFLKNMAYKCSQCDHTAEEAGNCQTCNVPLEEAKEESTSETQGPEKAE